ncbi:VOC family protein [Paenibacillus crassostreae]|uniref:Glyoxalase n=1 Tax=Paenibacillus crassostreae TaxID=1763538 RepID=A0A167AG45_9BACL|nr:VOC family protein [Paenibacillus crassostreae]AOZ92263.1 glyoxalase [Paenibacillus crassostreae]OAB70980.1 glyoxalase [Paenibacillus crassostreae]
MINILGQIMLYVNNQDESLKFWTEKAGFILISEADDGQGMKWFEIAPTKDAQTRIVLHNKDLVAKMSPGVNLETPSILFFSDNLDQLYKDYSDKNITVGELVNVPEGRVFNFADNEDNYFAVVEKKYPL